MTDGHSMFNMEDKIEAGSPLRLLAITSYEPVLEASKRLSSLYEGWETDELAWMLKTALLQAHYNLPNQLVEEHFKYHELFNWFVGGDSKTVRFDNKRYQSFLAKSLEDLELKEFIKAVVQNLNELRTSDEHDEQRIELVQKLTAWAETNSARIVYFGKCSYSPLRKIIFSFSFNNADLKSESFQALAKSICPEDANADYRKMMDKFRQDSRFNYDEDDDSEGVEDSQSAKNLFKSTDEAESEEDYDADDDYDEDEEEMLELSYNDRERRLYIQGNTFVQMELNPEQFDAWEDTVRPYAEQIIDTCKKPKTLVTDIYLCFENIMQLPPEVDLTEYFYMVPTLPPQITPPTFMRDQKHAYYLPQRAMRGSYDTDLLYDSFGQYLMISFGFEPNGEFLEVKLKLTTHWTDALHIESALEQLDTMKTNLNAAFHSIIKDKTRLLFE